MQNEFLGPSHPNGPVQMYVLPSANQDWYSNFGAFLMKNMSTIWPEKDTIIK